MKAICNYVKLKQDLIFLDNDYGVDDKRPVYKDGHLD